MVVGIKRRKYCSVETKILGVCAGISGEEKGELGRNSVASGLKEKYRGEVVGERPNCPIDMYGGARVEVRESGWEGGAEV